MSTENILKNLNEAVQTKQDFCKQAEKLEQISNILIETISSKGTIYACGNGGSACDAMHLVEELLARYSKERPGIKAAHFMDPGTITCWANDYDYNSAFERQAETLVEKNDCLIVFSTSGNSENILKALRAANGKGAQTIAFLGKGGGAAKSLAKTSLVVESDNTARIQEAHITAVHILVEEIETNLF